MIGSCPQCRLLAGCIYRTVSKRPTWSKLSVGLATIPNCHRIETSMPFLRTYSTDVRNVDVEPEEFGKIAQKKGVQVFKIPLERRLPKEEDEDKKQKPRFFSKFSPYWYFLQCKKLAKENKTKECLEFFEEKMLKDDGALPEEYNYSVVIGALGRAGQPKKAFQLYRQMRDRAIQPSAATYTGLFNSVAQCSDSSVLQMATGLYVKLHRNKIRMNRITYNALIKVYGRHGTTEQMMGIFRQSIASGFEPDSETFNMLMISFLKDKNAGFRKAIEVWRQMIMLGIKPDGKSVLYLLKVLKNCGIGDPETAYKKLILDLPNPNDYKHYFKTHIRNVYWLKGQQSTSKKMESDQLPPKPEILTIEPGVETDLNGTQKLEDAVSERLKNDSLADDVDVSVAYRPVCDAVLESSISLPPLQSPMPNLLDLPFAKEQDHPCLPVEIRKCIWPRDRLRLIGGHEYILSMFEKHGIKPTVMVLSSLVEVLPRSYRAENEVIEFAEKNRLKLDADFFNSILRRRASRNNYFAVKEILNKMVASAIAPNYRTWCISALSCTEGHNGVSLINEAANANVKLDHIFFNSLISVAIKSKVTPIKGYEDVKGYDYRYLSRILLKMKDLEVKADYKTILLLETASDWPQGYERWKVADIEFEKKVFAFRKHYNKWLNDIEVIAEEK